MTHSLGPTQVFHDLLANCLTNSTHLTQSNTHDMANTICVANINLTGHYRLVLGTYGQELLSFAWGVQEESII